MAKREGQLKGLNEVIGDLGLPNNVSQHLKNHSVWKFWAEIVGPELFRVTCPLEIKAHTLVIQVAHQAWAQQLHFLRTSILGKIRSQCGDSNIKDLQFRVGQIEHLDIPEETQKSSSQEKPEKELKEIRLSERQEMTLRAVEDPELRERIRKAMQAEALRLIKP